MRRLTLILTQPLSTTPLRIGATLLFFGWCAAMLGYHEGWKHGSTHHQPPQPTALERFFNSSNHGDTPP